jgi:hypothetical protein
MLNETYLLWSNVMGNDNVSLNRPLKGAKLWERLATVTALPVASPAAMPGTVAEPPASGGKVTLSEDEASLSGASGQEKKGEHFCSPCLIAV